MAKNMRRRPTRQFHARNTKSSHRSPRSEKNSSHPDSDPSSSSAPATTACSTSTPRASSPISISEHPRHRTAGAPHSRTWRLAKHSAPCHTTAGRPREWHHLDKIRAWQLTPGVLRPSPDSPPRSLRTEDMSRIASLLSTRRYVPRQRLRWRLLRSHRDYMCCTTLTEAERGMLLGLMRGPSQGSVAPDASSDSGLRSDAEQEGGADNPVVLGFAVLAHEDSEDEEDR